MDAIEILGSLLGHKTSRPGKGTDVLTEIFRGGSRKSPSPKASPQPSPRSSPRSSPKPRSSDISQQARELEELLNVANQRQSPPSRSAPASPRSQPASRPGADYRESPSSSADNEKARILVRTMVNAAKADGNIDQDEQQRILERLHNPSPDAIQFLRDEFQRPLNVREFATSVPIGMEQQVYSISLIAVDLDTGSEAKYLMELAEALRIPQPVREQIHQQMGAPSIY